MSEENVEARARELGWQPLDSFKGDPEKWVDAEEYVKRGEEMMPLLKATNRRLTSDLAETRTALTTLKEQLNASKEAIDALKEFNEERVKQEAEVRLAKLKADLVKAREDENVDEEVRIIKEIGKSEEAPAPAKPNGSPQPNPENDYTRTQEWKDWVEANPWWGVDVRKSAMATAFAQELRTKDPSLNGRALLDRISEEVEAFFSSSSRPPNRVESGGAGGGRPRGKTYDDLPAAAKEVCERQSTRLVGKDRAYATKQEWQADYAKKYFERE